MSNSKSYWRKQRWGTPPQTLTPLMEGPDPDMQDERAKKESSWEAIREWFKVHKGISGNMSSPSVQPHCNSYDVAAKGQDVRLLLGVLGCPLAPISVVGSDLLPDDPLLGSFQIKNVPFETSTAHYIIQQYLAATGCLKRAKAAKNMYATGIMKMSCCETEIAAGKSVKTLGGGGNGRSGDSGCFVLWQMHPGMWSLELVLGGTKLISGSDGKTVWRHTPWLGTHAAKGPQRPLRRLIQGLDPKTTAGLFAKAQCLGERRIGDDDCFVLKVSADRDSLIERNDAGAPAEVIRHALYGYFCQKSGLLIYLEDSHLTRVTTISPEDEAVYWETTIGSSIGDYRDVDGVAVAHCGRAVATVFRFGETSLQYSRTRMEEIWRIDDVVFDVPGLSLDSFIPPADIFEDDNNISTPMMSEKILCIQPSRSGVEDRFIWQPLPSGVYSTRSGYFSAAKKAQIPSVSTCEDFKWINDVWRSSCSPKLRLFLWSIINNALPIGENLQNRGMISATNCPRCNEKETKMHIFFTCPFAKEVWNLVPISHAVHIAAGMDFTEALTRFRRTICLPPTGVVGAIVPWIVWSLWLSRNTLIFEDKKITPGETTTKGLRLALEWNQAQRKEIKDSSLPEESRDRVHTTSANSPMNGSTTCKTDAAWDKKRKRAGLAWNFSGPTIPSPVEGSLVQDFIASPLIAEALALMTALGSAKDLGITKLEVFSDCATLIGAINGRIQRKELIGIVSDIRSISSGFTSLSFSYFPRSKNSLSDGLAKTVLRASVSNP